MGRYEVLGFCIDFIRPLRCYAEAQNIFLIEKFYLLAACENENY
jgi:hypothetical protein